jgi:hypothetical protein
MTQSIPASPVPGLPHPAGTAGSEGNPGVAAAGPPAVETSTAPAVETGQDPFAGLDQRPVDEHVAVFEAEHDRLQRRLGGIDQV